MKSKPIKHIVMFSGGVGSWLAARRVADLYGPKNLILLFTDTLIEDSDLYRFLDEAAFNVGAQLVWIQDGRTPWEVFFDRRLMGNTRDDPCSMVLKRELADDWIKKRYKPHECMMYVGIDWSEINRFNGGNKLKNGEISLGLRKRKLPYIYEAPLTGPPWVTKNMMIDELKANGIKPPRLYGLGFPHNNCGGFCVKAGQGHFKLLLNAFPERYRTHELLEGIFRVFIGKDVSILRDRVGGETKPFTLKDLRKRVEKQIPIDELDFGGCGCFID